MVSVPYGNGAFVMDLILPDASGSDAFEKAVKGLTWDVYSNLISRGYNSEVCLTMPVFKMEYDVELQDWVDHVAEGTTGGSSAWDGYTAALTADALAVDFAAAQGWPLILVASGRLGSINHIILSLEAAKARGMSVAGVVYNWYADVDPIIDADTPAVTRRVLEHLGFPPVVVKVRKQVRPVFSLSDVAFSPFFACEGASHG